MLAVIVIRLRQCALTYRARVEFQLALRTLRRRGGILD
jgi:hypothetical protein